MCEHMQAVALDTRRGFVCGKQGRHRSPCNLFVGTHTEGNLIGKHWLHAGVVERRVGGKAVVAAHVYEAAPAAEGKANTIAEPKGACEPPP